MKPAYLLGGLLLAGVGLVALSSGGGSSAAPQGPQSPTNRQGPNGSQVPPPQEPPPQSSGGGEVIDAVVGAALSLSHLAANALGSIFGGAAESDTVGDDFDDMDPPE